MWTKSKELQAPFYCPENAELTVSSQTLEGTVFSVKTDRIALKDIYLPLLGSYQINNCITVLEACSVLSERGLTISEENIRDGLKSASWAGRMEICGKEPLVILDGAHNADGILQLAKSMTTYFENRKVTLILGVLGDKEYDKMAEYILPHADTVILTEPHSERKLDVFSLARSIAHFSGTVYTEKEVNDAFDLLVRKCREKGIGVLGPVVPPTPENLRKNIEAGYSMIILGNDMWHFQKALKELVADSVEPVRNEH
jgi:dihydrofolate synthase/folylpolyglutamate synthase